VAWDVELRIRAPIERVFETLDTWPERPELRRLASVLDYRILKSDAGNEYFQLKVRDLLLKSSYCYGKRMKRRPDIIVTIFTYRFFRSQRLTKPAEIERRMHADWDRFFFNTTRLSGLGENLTLLRVNEPGGESLGGRPLEEIREFYFTLSGMAEGFGLITGSEAGFAESEGEGEGEGGFDYLADDVEKDPYAVLGLERGADFDLVKRAYRRLALLWHPDRASAPGAADKEYAHNKFIEIAAAYHSILRSTK
jgi:hypothetical protein